MVDRGESDTVTGSSPSTTSMPLGEAIVVSIARQSPEHARTFRKTVNDMSATLTDTKLLLLRVTFHCVL